MDSLNMAKRVFDTEIDALCAMRDNLDEVFGQVLDLITNCKGKVVLTGMGKPGHICRKMAATFASLGTPSFFLHPAEAQHGDLGMIGVDDVVIAISYSGESEEVIRLLPNIRLIGAKIVAITANAQSTLAKNCDVLQLLPPFEEACYMKLAPTSSTTVELVYGDALAVVAANRYGFTEKNFALFHPAGALGKKLVLTVKSLMATGEKNSVVSQDASLESAINELGCKQLGMVCIQDEHQHLAGLITDGDLRRALHKKVDIYNLETKDIMTKKPYYIHEDAMAVEALQLMKEKQISCLPVLDENEHLVGSITLLMLMNAGLVI
ncbi:KpsF/GutQ family sugar-phosphate isomerase [Pseudoflavonifractor capillosus]|uniref:KpsF/GutQ family sugar-phosphate isomerase n=1 Tax=Pseudoflavonifractor capillosus TaxID=106588 RepID=UPI00195AE998|nr:KpsF/GutQ family sugar-phosphate isomerase [Pseudoflavonifractor capillosus]MBM6896588.1 KpsF/GutQ family sugar-phosphate isomerase [Pseudoflavonifractor capillosus]